MKLRKIFVLFIGGVIILLGGCTSMPQENGDGTTVFESLAIQKYSSVEKYDLYEVGQPIIVYFPVVTNKEITKTELGGVATYLHISDGKIKVTLKPELQDKLNDYYNGFYISFLKYRVIMESINNLQPNDSVELCDTKIWIYHEEEFDRICIEEIYMRIKAVGNKNDECIPNWNVINESITEKIKEELQINRYISNNGEH